MPVVAALPAFPHPELEGPPGAFWPLTLGAMPPIPGSPLSTPAIPCAAPALLLFDWADAAPATNTPAQSAATTNLIIVSLLLNCKTDLSYAPHTQRGINRITDMIDMRHELANLADAKTSADIPHLSPLFRRRSRRLSARSSIPLGSLPGSIRPTDRLPLLLDPNSAEIECRSR